MRLILGFGILFLLFLPIINAEYIEFINDKGTNITLINNLTDLGNITIHPNYINIDALFNYNIFNLSNSSFLQPDYQNRNFTFLDSQDLILTRILNLTEDNDALFGDENYHLTNAVNFSYKDNDLKSIVSSYDDLDINLTFNSADCGFKRIIYKSNAGTNAVNYTLPDYECVNDKISLFVEGLEISSSSNNFTLQDILMGHVRWLKENVSQFVFENAIFPEDIENVYSLISGNLTTGDNWSAEVNISDGTTDTILNTTFLTILGNVPSQPTLLSPANSSTMTYPTGNIEFGWDNSTEKIDNDEISYILELSRDKDFTDVERRNITIEEEDNTTSILGEPEAGTKYWRVIANDTDGNSTASDMFTFTISTSTSLTLRLDGRNTFRDYELQTIANVTAETDATAEICINIPSRFDNETSCGTGTFE